MKNKLPAGAVGFIGLGDIGLPMACRLAQAGFQPLVYDVLPERITSAVASGARAAASLKQIAQECRYVLIVVVDAAQIHSLLQSEDGLFFNADPGATFICHSTMLPDQAKKLELLAKSKGHDWLDAPMSGGRVGAEAGTLAFLVGGPANVFEKCQPLLDVMGHKTFYLGDVGTGQVGKLVNATMCHLNYIVAMEALALASAYGIAEENIIDIVKVSTGNSWVTENWGQMEMAFLKRAEAGFTAEYERRIRKDLNYVLSSARDKCLSMPLVALGTELYPGLVQDRLIRLHDNAHKGAI